MVFKNSSRGFQQEFLLFLFVLLRISIFRLPQPPIFTSKYPSTAQKLDISYPINLGEKFYNTWPGRQGSCNCGTEHMSKRTTTDRNYIQTGTDRPPKRNDNDRFLEIQKIDSQIQTMSRPRYTTTGT